MSAAWTWGGRAVLAVNYDQAVRNVDSREHLTLTVEVPKERSGTRLMSLLWYGRTQNLVACGNNAMMQEREFQLWGPLYMTKCVHRESVDAGGGRQFFPLYDPDVDLIFVLGKKNCCAKLFEVDVARTPNMHALNCCTSSDSTLAARLLH